MEESWKATAMSSLRTSPAKWASIAAGAGFSLGLIGRYLQKRSRKRRVAKLVILDAR